MRLHEAVALGRNIRRINDKFWISPDEYKRYAICLEDAIDDLWEVEPLPEKKIELTREQLQKAWNKSAAPQFMQIYYGYKASAAETFEELCEELGFDD